MFIVIHHLKNLKQNKDGLLTGLEMMPIRALGATSAAAWTRSLTMDALVLNKSSRDMPGFRGTPAGIMMTWAPLSESYNTYSIALENQMTNTG